MTILAHSRNTDARWSTLSHVNGNQINYNGPTDIHYHFSVFGSRSASHYLPCDNTSPLITNFETPLQSSPLAIHRPVDALSAIKDAIFLIDHISKSLIDTTDSSINHHNLQVMLGTLRQILRLTKRAIKAYDGRLLGQSLTVAIAPEVNRCVVLLSELLRKLHETRVALICTHIRRMWRQIFQKRWDGDELASLKKRLYDTRDSLGMLIMALNSVVWIDLGNNLESSAEHKLLNRFHDLLRDQVPSLRHIQVNAVQVIDHLGRILPVPILFCSTWKEFDYIIHGYSKDGPGSSFIERGDYELLRPQGNQIVSRTDFTTVVKSEMIVEISIVKRQSIIFQDNKEKCPRCHYVNLNVSTMNGWIECRNCPGQFQIAKVDENTMVDEADEKAKASAEKVTEPVEKPRTESRKTVAKSNEKKDDAHNEESDKDDDEEVTSPASQSTESNTRQGADSGNLRPSDDDNLQFFRRIHIICTANDHIAKLLGVEESEQLLSYGAGPSLSSPTSTGSKSRSKPTEVVSGDDRRAQNIRNKARRFRVLIIGRANAGKTTILQRVCNAVEQPEIFDSNGKKIDTSVVTPSVRRGMHDINNELVFRSNPGFVFHDSRGFEAGDAAKIHTVKIFIEERSKMTELQSQLHVIWYCIPMDDERPFTAAERSFFSECGTGSVPVVAIFTKFDALEDIAYAELRREGVSREDAALQTAARAVYDFESMYLSGFYERKYPPKGHVYLRDLDKPETDCRELTDTVAAVLDDDDNLEQLFGSVQRNNLELCVKLAVERALAPAITKVRKATTAMPTEFQVEMTKWYPHFLSAYAEAYRARNAAASGYEAWEQLISPDVVADPNIQTKMFPLIGFPPAAQQMARLGLALAIILEHSFYSWDRAPSSHSQYLISAIDIYISSKEHAAVIQAVDDTFKADDRNFFKRALGSKAARQSTLPKAARQSTLAERLVCIALDNRLPPPQSA